MALVVDVAELALVAAVAELTLVVAVAEMALVAAVAKIAAVDGVVPGVLYDDRSVVAAGAKASPLNVICCSLE